MGRLERGLVQVYTGEGKGKTTAALGLALRALGHGLKVCMVQFLKGEGDIGERTAARQLSPALVIHHFGASPWSPPNRPTDTSQRTSGSGKAAPDWWQLPLPKEEKQAAQEGLAFARKVIKGAKYDLVILDEINTALALGVLSLKEVLSLLREKPPKVELVLTGRNAPPELVALADLVTEMREIKHPFHQRIPAREGIEF